MFNAQSSPRLFGMPPGTDFLRALVEGLIARSDSARPEDLARVEIFVNTRRMQRRMVEIFQDGPACLLPKIRLVTDLACDPSAMDIPQPISPLRRRLELSQLIAGLLDLAPDLAARSALFDLSDSLATLMDEMQGEGIPPDKIAALDVSDQSGHWARTLQFVTLIQGYFSEDQQAAPDAEARQRMIVLRLVEGWQASPPTHPVIIAGSTGSRGTTHLLMQAIAKLPQGAVILPGFDFDMPGPVWADMGDALTAEDHPQFRFARLMTALGVGNTDVKRWQENSPHCPARNRLVSLALRPAPVTDQWLVDGEDLGDLMTAVEDVTLVEAPDPRFEAVAIAMRLRQAAETGQTAALISPDRQLTRQVTAALDTWRIDPDDSAGRPLHLSAPGRFLRHVSSLFGAIVTIETLLTLLKHPLTHTGGDDRGQHLLWTRELELSLRRHGPPFPKQTDLTHWAEASRPDGEPDGRAEWALWLGQLLAPLPEIGARPLSDHVKHHFEVADSLAAGPGNEGSGELWEKEAGRVAKTACDDLASESEAGGTMTPADYSALFHAVLKKSEVRDPIRPHPGIMIWGTLEARVQGADLVILGGLNDGIWPSQPPPDPWLNRKMRLDSGLLLPERRIGLAAHDFQMAIASKEVWLTRSIRNAEAETVPSRWISRLQNLMVGLPDQSGETAWKAMQKRGQDWLALARAFEAPTATLPPANRPSPRPPINQRPRRLSVTRIKTLIRDPYAIYASTILKLRPLDPIRQEPDAPVRGTILHRVMERFIKAGDISQDALLEIAEDVLAKDAPWPAARRIWFAKLARVAPWFIAREHARQALGQPEPPEQSGKLALAQVDFTLTAKADRFDRLKDGTVHIYDYKTGAPPSKGEQLHFDKQLLLEAAMVERGAFEGLGVATVSGATFIGLGSSPREEVAPLDNPGIDKALEELNSLIRDWLEPTKGYTSRRAMAKMRYGGDYDHLARFGEWDETSAPSPEDMQ